MQRLEHQLIRERRGFQKSIIERLADVVTGAASNLLGDYLFASVEKVLGNSPTEPTLGYYTDFEGNVWRGNTVIAEAIDDGSIEDMSIEAIWSTFEFVERPSDGSDPAAFISDTALSEIHARDPNLDALIAANEIKLQELRARISAQQNINLLAAPEPSLCGLAHGLDLDRLRSYLNSQTKSRIRRCLRTSGDGKRVSREVHEYNYCTSSGQISQALASLVNYDATAGNGDLVASPATSTGTLTYGQFVDFQELRFGIAEIRKVERIIRSANMKFVFDILGESQLNAFKSNLLNKINWSNAIEQGLDIGVLNPS